MVWYVTARLFVNLVTLVVSGSKEIEWEATVCAGGISLRSYNPYQVKNFTCNAAEHNENVHFRGTLSATTILGSESHCIHSPVYRVSSLAFTEFWFILKKRKKEKLLVIWTHSFHLAAYSANYGKRPLIICRTLDFYSYFCLSFIFNSSGENEVGAAFLSCCLGYFCCASLFYLVVVLSTVLISWTQ